MKDYQNITTNGGQAMMIATILFLVVSVTIIFGMVGPILKQQRITSQLLLSRQSYFLAEAGIEDVLYRLRTAQSVDSTETLNLVGNSVTTVTTDTPEGKQIISTALFNDSVRKVQIDLIKGTGVAFHYGVQTGEGGLYMSNSSTIIGNAYSDGNIIGSNSARIQGTAIATGPAGIIEGMDIDNDSWSHTIRGNSTVGGNANHSVLQNTTVAGDVVADSISNCTISGTAVYDSRTNCTVIGGATTPNPDDFVPAPVLPLPISEAQIDVWEQDAEAGGVIGEQTFSSGTRTLGPVKINGDLNISGTAEVVVTGVIWVTGNVTLSNSAVIRLASSYGASSGLIMAGVDESPTDGVIQISNYVQILGSGAPGSYLMLLSQKEGIASEAIKMSNSSSAAILYAGEGEIEISNNADLKEVTAYKLEINNFAVVTYESGLMNGNFSSGPSGGWDIKSWKEVE